MEDNYQKAYREVIEILKYLPQESVNKIPKKMIKLFNVKMDRDYEFKIDENKNFEEQEIMEETKAILANIFRDYWSTPYQKERIELKEKNDRKKIEEEKKLKYNSDDIFKNRRKSQYENSDEGIIENITDKINDVQKEENQKFNSNLPIEIKKSKFFGNIIEFFKNLFKRK